MHKREIQTKCTPPPPHTRSITQKNRSGHTISTTYYANEADVAYVCGRRVYSIHVIECNIKHRIEYQ